MNNTNPEDRNYTGKIFKLPAASFRSDWEPRRDYEYNEFKIDLRKLDPEGTLRINDARDPNVNKMVPKVRLYNGCLYLELKREL